MKKYLFTLLSLFILNTLLFAAPNFPELTGMVVDRANILNSSQKQTLTELLKEEESKSSNQIVIVTLDTLDGYTIEEYGYQLGRYWQIGQKDKNNGVLLIVSMAEKAIRIEVGYGLEGALTDKISHEIIEYIIKPNFRQKNFYKGIFEASQAIVSAVEGEYKAQEHNVPKPSSQNWIVLYFIFIFLAPILANAFKGKKLSKVFRALMISAVAASFTIALFDAFLLSIVVFLIVWLIVFINSKDFASTSNTTSNDSIYWGSSRHSGGFGGFSGSSGGFGGFSGGGGSFGGGGASGGW